MPRACRLPAVPCCPDRARRRVAAVAAAKQRPWPRAAPAVRGSPDRYRADAGWRAAPRVRTREARDGVRRSRAKSVTDPQARARRPAAAAGARTDTPAAATTPDSYGAAIERVGQTGTQTLRGDFIQRLLCPVSQVEHVLGARADCADFCGVQIDPFFPQD